MRTLHQQQSWFHFLIISAFEVYSNEYQSLPLILKLKYRLTDTVYLCFIAFLPIRLKVRSRIWRFDRWFMCRLAILSIWFLSKFNSVKCLQFLKRPDGSHLSLFLAKSIFSKKLFPSKTSLPIDSKWFPWRLITFTDLRCSKVWPVKSVSWLNSILRRSRFFRPLNALEPTKVILEKPKFSSLRFPNFSKKLWILDPIILITGPHVLNLVSENCSLALWIWNWKLFNASFTISYMAHIYCYPYHIVLYNMARYVSFYMVKVYLGLYAPISAYVRSIFLWIIGSHKSWAVVGLRWGSRFKHLDITCLK